MADSVNIPQANSVETLTYVVEAIDDGIDTVEKLVVEFDVRERTIHYYLELAEWLGFLKDRKATQFHLTKEGAHYAEDVSLRAGLYEDGVLQHPLVQRALRQAEARDYDSLRESFTEVISRGSGLAEATAKRRAGALATLLIAALEQDEVEWETGRMGQPTRMRRKYAHDAPKVDESADTSTWERPRNPGDLVGEDRLEQLKMQIGEVLQELGTASSSQIRDELSMRYEVSLTDPSVFVVLRVGLEENKWLADHQGHYSLL